MEKVNDSELGRWVKEHTLSPMTTWLNAAPKREMFAGPCSDGTIDVWLIDGTTHGGTVGHGKTVEEAMANALNAMMIRVEPQPASSQSEEPPKSSA